MNTEVSDRHVRGSVVCVGDLLVDVWWYVDTAARNVEHAAVALVSEPADRKVKPGGVGIVADALGRAGFLPVLFSTADNLPDTYAAICKLALQDVNCANVARFHEFKTPVKTRYINANGHILVRHDSENVEKQVYDCGSLADLVAAIKSANCVVVSDYNKGCIPPTIEKEIVACAIAAGVPIYVDAKPQNMMKYAGADMFKMNMPELMTFARSLGGEYSIESAMQAVADKLRTPLLVATDGGSGVYYCHKHQKPEFMPTPRKYSAGNCVGAGDTFLVGLLLGFSELNKYSALELTSNNVFQLMQFGLIAAGQRIRENSAKPFNANKVLSEIYRKNEPVRRLMTPDDLIEFAKRQHKAGRKVVFTNGCFDLLHAGHVALLTAAKREGDVLLVAVDSDANVSRLKGSDRPIQPEKTRAGNIAALDVVDAVCIFTDQDDNHMLRYLIEHIKPSVLVKGADYAEKQIVGYDEVIGQDPPGRVVLVSLVPNSSTTAFVNKIKAVTP
jgi:D-beta-D-heptose 7-phosphate kinase/D-beta-D-heptose 1-phosphate adenosyltransferase